MMESRILTVHKNLKNNKISCVNLVRHKLEALEKSSNNTVNFLLSDAALAKAKEVDKKIKNKESLKILEGIPFGLKDVYLLQGYFASASSNFLRNYKAPYTATAVQKLLDAGAIPIVKENCDSFGHGSTSENTVFGAVKNAHNQELVAGGSTGGGAVNVAKDYTVFSLGGDTGGSIRQPSGFNKVYGLKPTYGRVSRFGIMAYASSTDCVGPIAKTLEDIRIILNTISGKDSKDQTSFSSQPIAAWKNMDFKSMTIGYYTDFMTNEGLNDHIKMDFFSLTKRIKQQGIKIKPLNFKDTQILVSSYYILALAETASNLARLDGTSYGQRLSANTLKESYALTRSNNFTAETKQRIISGNQILSQGYSDEIYAKSRILKTKIIHNFSQDFEKVNLLLSPVSPTLPPKIGNSLNDTLSMYLSDIYTVGFSLAGLPTLSAPIGTQTGIQITGRKNQEEAILKFAGFLENV